MARKSKFDADGEKLRQMGLDPDRMTIRERFEALGGVPEGRPLPEVLEEALAKRNTSRVEKKRPSESVSAGILHENSTRNPFSAIKPASNAQVAPKGTQNTGSTTGLTLFDVSGTSSSAISPARLESVPKSMSSKQDARSKHGSGMSLLTTAVQTALAL